MTSPHDNPDVAELLRANADAVCVHCGAGMAVRGVCDPCWMREYEAAGDGTARSLQP